MLLTELKKIAEKSGSTSTMVDGKVTGYGSSPDKFEVTLTNGAVVSNVIGPTTMLVGDSAIVSRNSGRYSILGKGSKTKRTLYTTFV